jgi:hypothetical protein
MATVLENTLKPIGIARSADRADCDSKTPAAAIEGSDKLDWSPPISSGHVTNNFSTRRCLHHFFAHPATSLCPMRGLPLAA